MSSTIRRAVREPDATLYPLLRTPLTLHASGRGPGDAGALRLPHRVLMGSMHINLENSPDALAAFYVERVRGGAAMITTGGAAVSRVGAGSASYSLINEPEHQEHWRRVVEAVHREGGRIALQLFHAGRYAFESAFGLVPVGPSAVYSRFARREPIALSDQGIHDTIADFASGARAAAELGFDAVEVMGSEGYLINQFASPLTNVRDDAWGGDAERRRAFPVAVLRAVVDAAGTLPVIARTSAADLMPGSSTPEEADALAVALADAGAAAISFGVGWHEARVPTVQSMVPHVAWGEVAGRMRAALAAAAHDGGGAGESFPVPLIASNRINSLEQAERVLADGQGDLVAMSRPFLADPHIVATSFAGRAAFVNPCIGCNEACIDRSFGLEPISCTVNPRAGRELDFVSDPRQKTGDTGTGLQYTAQSSSHLFFDGSNARRRIAVIGSGPAGLEAARAAAFAGAEVELFEAHERIGGQFLLAGAVPGKGDFLGTVQYFERTLRRLGATVHTGRAVTDARELTGFDHVIVASGVTPRQVSLPGLGEAGTPAVMDYHQAFENPERVGERVAVIGAGGIAVDLAHFLVEPPLSATGDAAREEERRRRFLVANGVAEGEHPAPARGVTIMRRSGAIGAGMGVTTRWAAVQAIRRAGVRTLTGVEYLGVEDDGVRIRYEDADELIAADTVVVAAGQVANGVLEEALAEAGTPYTVVGGALDATGLNAVAAFEQGLRAGDAAARPAVSGGNRSAR